MTDRNDHVARRLGRALALTPGFLLVFSAWPALAIPPEQWPPNDPVSALNALLILVGIPLALFLFISVMVYVPSMARGEKYTPGLAWRNESEWFGGPRGGVEAADKVEQKAIGAGTDPDRGGASARW